MRSAVSLAEPLDRKALSRALLARQFLLRRAELPALDVLEHLVGMQAQVPAMPYVALWSRVDGFVPAELAGLVQARRAVRIALMRSTIHLVSARDCIALRPAVAPVLLRGLEGTYGKRLDGVDATALAAAGRVLVEERPRTFSELGAMLAERWPERDPDALAQAVRAYVPLVQVPPRGIWGASGRALHTSAEAWLGRPIGRGLSVAKMVLRYLAAFGPATVADVQTWSGMRRLREVVDTIRPQLRRYRDEGGAELLDLPDAPRPEAGTPAPPRFLPGYDNILLSHANRARIISDEDRKRISAVNGVLPGTVLVDGFVRAAWKVVRARDAATLVIEPFRSLSKRDAASVTAEGARLLRFAEADTGTRDVRISSGYAAAP